MSLLATFFCSHTHLSYSPRFCRLLHFQQWLACCLAW